MRSNLPDLKYPLPVFPFGENSFIYPSNESPASKTGGRLYHGGLCIKKRNQEC